jgi:hypothetical protein
VVVVAPSAMADADLAGWLADALRPGWRRHAIVRLDGDA